MALYQGKENSLGKLAARRFVYGHNRLHNPTKFHNGTHIVISSRECGDILFLREREVKKSNIIACDLDKLARQAAWRLGVRVSPYPDIVDTVKWAIDLRGKEDIASVNVDLCGHVRSGCRVMENILRQVGRDTSVFLTFVRGRDEGMYSTEDRIDYLADHLQFYRPIPQDNYFCYQSSTDTSRGAPMCAFVL